MSDPQQAGFPWRKRIAQLKEELDVAADSPLHDRREQGYCETLAERLAFILDDAEQTEADALPAPTCATCRFWERHQFGPDAGKHWGGCRRDREDGALIDGHGDVDDPIETHESFGCLQHEARQP